MNLDEFVRAFCSGTKEGKGGPYQKGFTLLDSLEVGARVPKTFAEQEEWADGLYRRVWVSRPDRAIITYCEGDIMVDKFTSDDAHRG